MYGFVDTIPGSGTGSTSVSIQTVFNGINLDEELTDENGSFVTLTVSGRSDTQKRIETIEIPGKDGVVEQDKPTLEPRIIIVKYKIADRTNNGFRKRLDKLNALLEGSKKKLQFTDEEALFYATLQTNKLAEENSNNLVGELVFLCSDPFKYGPEYEAIFPTDVVSLNYDGTTPGEPVFELEALQPVTFAMIQNQNNEYMMIGQPIDIEAQVPVQREERVFWSQADSLVGWTTAEQVDGTVAGSMESNGYSFQPVDYGTGTGWHGPAMKTSLTEVLTDFHLEAIVELYNGDTNMIGRVEVYLLDEAGVIIGKIGLKDIYPNARTVMVDARIGDSLVNYQLMSGSGEYHWVWNDFYGILRIGRHAGTWFAYIAKIDQSTGKHHSRMYREFNDVNNQFTKNLAQIAVHFGQMGTYTPANVKVHDIKVYKWNAITQNEVPYIAQTGDIITFDHTTKDLSINGESRKDLKDFGATFFKLQKGENQFVVLPSNSFATKVRYRERFL